MFSFREVADLIFLSNFEIPKLGKEALLMKPRVAGLTTARVVNLFRAILVFRMLLLLACQLISSMKKTYNCCNQIPLPVKKD